MRTVSPQDKTISKDDVEANIQEWEGELESLTDSVNYAESELEEAQEALGHEDLKDNQEALADAQEALEDAQEALEAAQEELKDWREEFAAPLTELKKFLEGMESYGDFAISENYWREYANQQIDEALGDGAQNWPFNCIDYEQARNALEADYSGVEFAGVTFYIQG